MLTQSEENYLKAIYSLSDQQTEMISTNLLADKMLTKASSVTDMVKKLSDKSLITYYKYQGCQLTPKGNKMALQVIRKHRLWEVFLVDKLKFGWEEVHDIAEQLEHIQSIELTDKLDEFLDFPQFDPHGDPIPDKNGIFKSKINTVSLLKVPIGKSVLVTGVQDGSIEFFQFLKHYDIGLGTKITVIEKHSFDQSMLIEINQKEINLSSIVTQKIYVQY